MKAEEVLDRFVSIYGWDGRRIWLFGSPAMSIYAGLHRLTVIPVTAIDLWRMAAADSFPATWDFVHGQIVLAIAGHLHRTQYLELWKRLRRSHLIDLWLEDDMRTIAAENAAAALKEAGIFLLLPD
ncbi:MAG: hypothetical protein AAF704_14585 [Cyanobacteria bacterium P01_D01_bin.123]